MLKSILRDHLDEVIVGLVFAMIWVRGIVHDAAADRAAWVIADIFVPPLGVLRGLASLI